MIGRGVEGQPMGRLLHGLACGAVDGKHQLQVSPTFPEGANTRHAVALSVEMATEATDPKDGLHE